MSCSNEKMVAFGPMACGADFGAMVRHLPAGTKILVCGGDPRHETVAYYLVADVTVTSEPPAPRPRRVAIVGRGAGVLATLAREMATAVAGVHLAGFGARIRHTGPVVVESSWQDELAHLEKLATERVLAAGLAIRPDLTSGPTLKTWVDEYLSQPAGLDTEQMRQDLLQLQLPKEAPAKKAVKQPYRGYSNHRRKW
jgi:hypothetical protein